MKLTSQRFIRHDGTGETVLTIVFLLFQSVNAWGLIARYSVTINEAAHIPSGLAYWYFGDFGIYCVNPPLAKVVATAPLLLRNDVDISALLVPRDENSRDEFAIGYFFSETNKSNYHDLVLTARMAGIVWLFVGGILLSRFASSLFWKARRHCGRCFVG